MSINKNNTNSTFLFFFLNQLVYPNSLNTFVPREEKNQKCPLLKMAIIHLIIMLHSNTLIVLLKYGR